MLTQIGVQNDILARYDEILSAKASKHAVSEIEFELRNKYDDRIDLIGESIVQNQRDLKTSNEETVQYQIDFKKESVKLMEKKFLEYSSEIIKEAQIDGIPIKRYIDSKASISELQRME